MITIDLDSLFQNAKDHLVDLLFPPKCIFCRKNLLRASEFGGAPKHASGNAPAVCFACETAHPLVGWVNGATKLGPGLVPVDGVFAGCEYTELVKSAVVRLKFYEVTGAAKPLAYMMARGLRHYADLFDFVIPVPLSRERLASRGFNQSELISAEICRLIQTPLDAKSLLRVRHTKKQSLTKGQERLENVSSAFQVSGNSIAGKRVLIIDDVLTTGSTAAECARILRAAGATKIYVAVVALAI